MDEFNLAKSKMASTFDKAMTEAEELRKAAPDAAGAGSAAAPVTLEHALEPAFDKAGKTAAAAEDYMQTHPWIAIGIAAAAGLLVGFVAARR